MITVDNFELPHPQSHRVGGRITDIIDKISNINSINVDTEPIAQVPLHCLPAEPQVVVHPAPAAPRREPQPGQHLAVQSVHPLAQAQAGVLAHQTSQQQLRPHRGAQEQTINGPQAQLALAQRKCDAQRMVNKMKIELEAKVRRDESMLAEKDELLKIEIARVGMEYERIIT